MAETGKTSESNITTICATVNSGFEHLANQECIEKFGSISRSRTVKKFRGRIIFELPVKDVKKAAKLRSVDNLSVLVNHIKDVDLQQDKNKAIADLSQKILESNWKLALDTWRNFRDSNYCLDPLPGALSPSNSVSRGMDSRENMEDDSDAGPVPPSDKDSAAGKRPTFRVTCTRTGEKHKFSSRDVAPAVGSLINETFGWPVKMKEFDIEVMVNILEDSTMVAISLTKESLHRRNITHFGITTLKSTIAYCMLRMAQPKSGEVIIDPMCGVGGIPLEATGDWKCCHIVAGDHNTVAVERTKANFDSLSQERKAKHIERPDIGSDVMKWDVTNLPLRSSSVDVFITDLISHQCLEEVSLKDTKILVLGSRSNNWSLYSKCLEEMGRVCCPGTGRAVLLTQDKKCMVQTLKRCHHIWRKKNFIFINHGGLKACVYLLTRPKVKGGRKKMKMDEQGDEDQHENEDEDDVEDRDELE